MSTQQVVIRADSAWAGPDLAPIDDAVVIVEGARITTVAPRHAVDLPTGAAEVDARGLTLVPGFIDAHVHIAFYPPAEVLRGGVTTVRDLAWPPEQIFPLAASSRSDDFDGPTIVAAGPMLTVPGGYPMNARWAPEGTGVPLTSPSEAEDAVERAAAQGAIVIKVGLDPHVGPTLPKELLAAIADAAHERGLKVTAHIYGLDELEKALDAGLDELAHMLMSTEAIPDEVLDRMVAAHVAIVPTLSCRSGRDLALATQNLARFLRAGGQVIYGTDLGNEGPGPGIDPTEVAGMAAAGMAPRDIVRAATVDAAQWLRLERTGTLAAGMSADIVGLRGDLTADLGALTDVALVMRRGSLARSPN